MNDLITTKVRYGVVNQEEKMRQHNEAVERRKRMRQAAIIQDVKRKAERARKEAVILPFIKSAIKIHPKDHDRHVWLYRRYQNALKRKTKQGKEASLVPIVEEIVANILAAQSGTELQHYAQESRTKVADIIKFCLNQKWEFDGREVHSKVFNSNDIFSRRRERRLVRVRQMVMYLSKQLTPHSYPEIGRYMGGRDHTTVLHAAKIISPLVEAGKIKINGKVFKMDGFKI